MTTTSPTALTAAATTGFSGFTGFSAFTGSAAASAMPAVDRRVTIISAGVGGGHDGAASALAKELAALGFSSDRHDFLDLMPGRSGKVMCGSYKRMLATAPWLYQSVYERTERAARPGLTQRRILRASEDAVLATIGPDTVAAVATYPLAAQVLGRLRAQGRLHVPVITYFTDISVHPLWIAPGVDLYLAEHQSSAAIAAGHGAPRTVVTRPLVSPKFRPATATDRAFSRIRFGLSDTDRIALVVGGSWGVGDVEGTVRDIVESGAATPVVVCGRNAALRDTLRASGLAHVFGWVGDMPGLMQAADVLVTSGGGLSTLEAFASGLPVVTYRCIPGHGVANAAVMAEAGLAPWVRSRGELGSMLAELADQASSARLREAGLDLFSGPSAAELVAELSFAAAVRAA